MIIFASPVFALTAQPALAEIRFENPSPFTATSLSLQLCPLMRVMAVPLCSRSAPDSHVSISHCISCGPSLLSLTYHHSLNSRSTSASASICRPYPLPPLLLHLSILPSLTVLSLPPSMLRPLLQVSLLPHLPNGYQQLKWSPSSTLPTRGLARLRHKVPRPLRTVSSRFRSREEMMSPNSKGRKKSTSCLSLEIPSDQYRPNLECHKKGFFRDSVFALSAVCGSVCAVMGGVGGILVRRPTTKLQRPGTGGEQGSQGQSGTSDAPAAAGGPGGTAPTAFELQDYSRGSGSQSSLNRAPVEARDPVTGIQR